MTKARDKNNDPTEPCFVKKLVLHFEPGCDFGKAAIELRQSPPFLRLEDDAHHEAAGLRIVELCTVQNIAAIAGQIA